MPIQLGLFSTTCLFNLVGSSQRAYPTGLVLKEKNSDLETIVLGDFNSNALKQQSNMFSTVKHLMFIFNWVQLINTPTRITPTSESCLDLIFVSLGDKISQSGVINIGLSDHFLTYCTRKVQRGSLKHS